MRSVGASSATSTMAPSSAWWRSRSSCGCSRSAPAATRLFAMTSCRPRPCFGALEELRELAQGLHPTILTSDGLSPALRLVADRAGVPVTVKAPEGRFSDATESTAYFVVSEALANVSKYAQASQAEVCVENSGGRLVVSVTDDGIGGADRMRGSGLTGLADRVAAAVGGEATSTAPREAGPG